jgi:hypothetical protein
VNHDASVDEFSLSGAPAPSKRSGCKQQPYQETNHVWTSAEGWIHEYRRCKQNFGKEPRKLLAE